MQVIKLNTVSRNWEMWGHHPSERQRLFDLIGSTKANGVVFISGDMHFAEIFRTKEGPYPLYDITASGLDQDYKTSGTFKAPSEQVGKSHLKRHFGGIVIDWEKAALNLEIRDIKGERQLHQEIKLSDLQVPAE